MRVGLSSIVGDGFGFGSFVFGEVTSGGGCPAAGTPTGTNTSLIEYPVANGGEWIGITLWGEGSETAVPNQNAQFPLVNDGSCGTEPDYNSAFNISYKSAGVIFDTDYQSGTPVDFEIPYLGSGNFYIGGYSYPTRVHDGSGGFNLSGITEYLSNGTPVGYNEPQQAEVPSGYGNYYDTGAYSEFRWDGVGGYYSVFVPNYHPEGTPITTLTTETEVPSGSSSYYPNGRSFEFTWNGSGGYNQNLITDYYPIGTLIFESVDSTGTFELPNLNVYTGTFYGNKYTWNGVGGYNVENTWFVPYGTFIEEYDSYNYYHDGFGSYYSVPV